MADARDEAAEYVRVIPAGELSEGEGRTLDAGGRWIALFLIGGAYYAIDNACPHMAGPLGAGSLDGFAVVCPLHAWVIDVRTGRAPTNDCVRVGRYDVRVEDGWVWVRTGGRPLPPDPRSMPEPRSPTPDPCSGT